jgi:hypothetical protein
VQSPITELARVRRKKEQRNYKQYRNWKVWIAITIIIISLKSK